MPPVNPFHYGREVDQLVDREDEVARSVAVAESASTLFLLGPRRFGKTSILKTVAREATARGTIVLRYDAEAFETIDLLARAIATGATRAFAGTMERAGELVRRVFGALKASASFDLTHQTLTVDFGVSTGGKREATAVLTEVLNGVERLAAEHKRRTAVILDEFQEVIEAGGERAEKQIRAAVQTHQHVAYIFAGSKTHLLADMTGDASRPFWKKGDRLILGPIPRAAFRPFVRDGLMTSGAAVDDAAVEHIFDLAEDVPYNVQWLSSKCWETARLQMIPVLTSAIVGAVQNQILDEDHAVYMQLWANLTGAQRLTLKAVVAQAGAEFRATAVARAVKLPPSTMQRTLDALEDRSIVRRQAMASGVSWRLDDPFFAHWLTRVQAPDADR